MPTMNVFALHEDGEIENILPMSLGSTLHPQLLKDGRIAFSSYESQGARDQRLWGVWLALPDGRAWGPIASAFKNPLAFHFTGQLPDGSLGIELYYNQNNFTGGTLIHFPADPPTPAYHTANGAPLAEQITETRIGGQTMKRTWPFQNKGAYNDTPFTTHEDQAAPCPIAGNVCDSATRLGKITTPSGAPGNRWVLAWSGGPVNALNRPTSQPKPNWGIYASPPGGFIASPADLTLIVDDPNANEVQPRPILSWEALYGAPPVQHEWLPQTPLLPEGSPYGLVGTSSTFAAHRSSAPGSVPQAIEWQTQGSDAGEWTDADIAAMRILYLEPGLATDTKNLRHIFNERIRIGHEFPTEPVDGSFWGRVVANAAWTFQLLDGGGR